MEHEFIQRFTEIWKEHSWERLIELLHPDVVLYQPHLPPARGRQAVLCEFQDRLKWQPSFSDEVKRWSSGERVVLVEWQISLPLRGRMQIVRAIDRFRLVGVDHLVLLEATLRPAVVWHTY